MSRLLTILLAACLALASVSVRAADDADVARLQARMDTLQADPALGRMAAFEQMEARQAIARLDDARRSERAGMLYVAERRVEIAETAAAAESARRELAALDLQRSELLLQASRRDAERARQEAERLRIQSQIQAEETARLRQAAEEEAQARQEAETVLQGVSSREAARLKAARERAAELKRQEEALMRSLEGESKPGTRP